MKFLDTNVILRYLTKDDEAKAEGLLPVVSTNETWGRGGSDVRGYH